MTKYTEEELTKILEDHKLWLNDNKTGKRANLENANLVGANLYKANLSDANLSGVDLRDAIFWENKYND
tara:strand:- start:71 stop:277 length:207 start_codon:yes stop_codon:yes gene_type:complete